jgi:alpha-glucosidase (family GH31 glycosyl hydrolase)
VRHPGTTVALASFLALAACGANAVTFHNADGGGAAADAAAAPEDAAAPDAADLNDGVAVAGHARFTVITPTLVRLEYDAVGRFVDTPSYFAAERDARFRGATITTTPGGVTIDTGVLELRYVNDGQPFSATNLSATVHRGTTPVVFTPAPSREGNLGGTTQTLDRWVGAGALDDGVLSRAGGYVLDDSGKPLVDGGWARPREDVETDWYLFGYGLDHRAALASLTAIGGAVPMPRAYALGAWYSRYWPYSADDFEAIVKEYDQHDFPLDVVVLDMDWHEAGWTGWSWNRDLIPDPAGLLAFLHAHGLAATLNMHPADGVAPHEDAYAAFMGALGLDPASGTTVPFDAADERYMDALFAQVHGPLRQAGADFFCLDWHQDRDTRGLPGLENIPWLNQLYYRYTAEGGARGLSFSRWGGFGDHRHPIHFSGDASTSFEMLAFEVPFTATSGNAGLFYWTHDIGGHTGPRNEESYTRWCQFGAFSAVLRSHSAHDAALDRRPWTYPAWAEASMKVAFQLRARFFPYVYSSVWQSSSTSVPLLRPMYLDDAAREDAYRQPQEYAFGDTLLVAPIVEAGAGPARLGRQVVWFPAGTYYNYFTGERFDGPGEHLVAATIDELPLFVKAGVPLPTRPFTRRMATTPVTTLEVRCYPGAEGQKSSFDLHEDDGLTAAGPYATTRLGCERHGNDVAVTIAATSGTYAGQPGERAYTIEIPATARASAATVDGAAATAVYSAAEAVNRVTVPARSIHGATIVHVTAAPLDPAESRRRAFAKRVGLDAGTRTLVELAQAAWAAAGSDGALRLAVLAAAGVGVLLKNEHVYGYPAASALHAYQDPGSGATASLAATWSGAEETQRGSVTYAGTTIAVDAAPLAFDFDHPGVDLARTATAEFSSLESSGTVGIADGVVGGYPGERGEEWSTHGETTGAWVKLGWATPETVGRVVLYDRVNGNDQITGATLTFSDGSSVAVGALRNQPLATPSHGSDVIGFPARSVTWVKLTVTSVSALTENIGLSEMAVYRP